MKLGMLNTGMLWKSDMTHDRAHIKCIINVMCLNQNHTFPTSHPCSMEKLSSQNWFLVPKMSGTAVLL